MNRGARWSHPGRWLPTLVALVVVAGIWEAIALGHPYVLPRLGDVGTQLVTQPTLYLASAWATLREALAGLVVGVVAAMVLAVAVSEVAVLRRAILPLAVILNVTPVVALAPALVVAFGFGVVPKVIVTAVITFFPVLVGATTGMRSVPADVLDVFTSVRASRLEVLWWVRLPTSLPFVFAALRVVFPLSLVGAVVAEFVAAGSSTGLGTVISVAASTSQLSRVYAAVACLAILGLALLALVTTVEKRVISWHESQLRRR